MRFMFLLTHIMRYEERYFHFGKNCRTSLREKCPYSEFFWSVFSRVRTEYGEIWSKKYGKNTTDSQEVEGEKRNTKNQTPTKSHSTSAVGHTPPQ